jgi:hypothetical protein
MRRDLFPVKVECYSGYKSDEYPIRFFWDEAEFEIHEIIDRWYQQESSGENPAANYYKIRTTDKKTYLLKQETETGQWFLWIKGERLDL